MFLLIHYKQVINMGLTIGIGNYIESINSKLGSALQNIFNCLVTEDNKYIKTESNKYIEVDSVSDSHQQGGGVY